VMYIGTTVAGLIGGPLLTLTGNFTAIGITAFLLSTASALMIRPSDLGEEVNQQNGRHAEAATLRHRRWTTIADMRQRNPHRLRPAHGR